MSLNYSKGTTSRVEGSGSVVSFQPQAETLTYEPYFGLSEKPFSLNADARFVYDSPAYVAARQGLLAGIRRREGLLVLTGEIGTGKTTLCRAVLRDLGRKTCSSLVPDPFASREDLLKMLLIDFGVFSIEELTTGPLRTASRTELGFHLSEFLNTLAPETFVIVVIDEAQNLSLPLIEETRILSDTFGARGRLQIIFVGQPELHAKLKLPEMRQVDQRVCGYHRLAPMSRDAVAGYIQHRLQVAGSSRDRVLFSPAVVEVLHQRSGGVPRLVNRVCDRALHLAHERQADGVTRDILDTALIELGAATLSPTWDSIIFATPSPALPAPSPAPEACATQIAPLDDEQFEKQVDSWVQQDLAPASRKLPPRQAAFADEASAGRRRPAPRARTVPRPVAPIDWPKDHSQTYMEKLWRRWAKRAAIGVGGLLAANLVMAGASVLSSAMTPTAVPSVPEAPAVARPGVPVVEASQADIAPGSAPTPSEAPAVATGAGEFLVAVGMFASTERADQLVDALTQAGLPAMQRPVQLRRQQVQQIVLGPFFSRLEAAAGLQRLQALGGYDDARITTQ